MNITDIIVRSETVASRKNNVGKDRMKLNNHLKKKKLNNLFFFFFL